MRKDDIDIGGVYTAKVSGAIVKVKIVDTDPYDGRLICENLTTGRKIKIKSGRRLREKVG